MVITETRLTKKVITDEEGTGPLLRRIVAEDSLEVERTRVYVLSADIESSRTHWKLSGIRIACIAWKGDKTT